MGPLAYRASDSSGIVTAHCLPGFYWALLHSRDTAGVELGFGPGSDQSQGTGSQPLHWN